MPTVTEHTRAALVARARHRQLLAQRLRSLGEHGHRISQGDLRRLLIEAADTLDRLADVDPDATDTFALPELAGLEIVRATNQMPFAGGLNLLEPVTVGGITGWIGALADRLHRHARQDEDDQRELQDLRDQRQAIRDFLGTNQGA